MPPAAGLSLNHWTAKEVSAGTVAKASPPAFLKLASLFQLQSSHTSQGDPPQTPSLPRPESLLSLRPGPQAPWGRLALLPLGPHTPAPLPPRVPSQSHWLPAPFSLTLSQQGWAGSLAFAPFYEAVLCTFEHWNLPHN